MSTITHPNKIHEATVNQSEMTRQVAIDAAIRAGGTSAAVQAAVTAQDVAHLRRVISSCQSNSVEAGVYRESLHELTGSYA